MTSINELDLPQSLKDKLIKASLDTIDDLLLYIPPGLVDDIPAARFKRHQPYRGASSTSYDRLNSLTPQEISLAYDSAAAYVFEARIAYGSALDLLTEEYWLSLGDPVLDTALGGRGLMTRGITEIAGESAVGKTQLCLQLCLTVQLPLELGGLDGSAVWLSTEGKFPYSRLESMIEHFVTRYEEQIPEINAAEIRDNIYFDSMADQETQLHILNYQLPILIRDSHLAAQDGEGMGSQEGETYTQDTHVDQTQRPNKKPVKLIIIDSITNNFRSELNIGTSIGPSGQSSGFRSSILQRSSELCEIGFRLRTLADQYGMTVICVNQVTDVFGTEAWSSSPGSFFDGPSESLSIFRSMDEPTTFKKPALGLVWENTINARVILQRSRLLAPQGQGASISGGAAREPQRTMSVIFSPWASNNRNGRREESGFCRYKIDDTGVSGISVDD